MDNWMSLPDRFPEQVPALTSQIVGSLLGEMSLYRMVGDHIHEMIDEDGFIDMYSVIGRPGISPMILLLVTLFQFVEKLPDRQATEMARTRMDWKYALRQELTWAGFHYADLCNFRKRLLAHDRFKVIFDQLVTYLREHNLIRVGANHRTDSTHILGAVRQLSRLELIWETLRLTMSELISTDARWVVRFLPATFVEEHSQRRSDYRLSDTQLVAAMQQAGADGFWLVEQVESLGSHLQAGSAFTLLKRVLDEQFERRDDGLHARSNQDSCGDVVDTPHDPDSRYGAKGGQHWHGYKLQVTETVGAVGRFITDVAVTTSLETDNRALPAIHQRLHQRQLLPTRHYVDQGYVDGQTIEDSQRLYGVNLRGRVQNGSPKPVGFRLSDFQINVPQRRVICPGGRESTRWKTVDRRDKKVAHRVWFGAQCRDCVFFAKDLCTTHRRGRALDISPYHETLQARRTEMAQPTFQQEMRQRHGIEATISELVRAHGARRSRYRGLQKTRLQAHFVAAATNLKRLVKVLGNRPAANWLLFQARTVRFSTKSHGVSPTIHGELAENGSNCRFSASRRRLRPERSNGKPTTRKPCYTDCNDHLTLKGENHVPQNADSDPTAGCRRVAGRCRDAGRAG
jgi:transposase